MRSLLLAAVAVAAFAAEGRGQQSGCAQRPIVVIGIKTQAEMPFLNALREFNLLVRSYAPAPQTKAK